MMKKSKTIFLNSALYATTGLVFYLLFSRGAISGTLQALKQVNKIYFLAAALISVLVNIFISSDLLRRFLRALKFGVSLKESIFIKMGSLPFKFIPAVKELGVIKALYLQRYYGMPFALGVFLSVLANILSVISLIIFFLCGYVFLHKVEISAQAVWLVSIFISLSIFFLLLFIALIFFKKPICGRIIALSKEKGGLFYEAINNIFSGLNKFKPVNIINLTLYTMLFQSSELLIFYILSKALSLDIPFYAILLYLPVSILVTKIPVTISGLGVREAVTLFFFSGYGSKPDLLGLGILVSFTEHILPVLISLFALFPFVDRLKMSQNHEDSVNTLPSRA